MENHRKKTRTVKRSVLTQPSQSQLEESTSISRPVCQESCCASSHVNDEPSTRKSCTSAAIEQSAQSEQSCSNTNCDCHKKSSCSKRNCDCCCQTKASCCYNYQPRTRCGYALGGSGVYSFAGRFQNNYGFPSSGAYACCCPQDNCCRQREEKVCCPEKNCCRQNNCCREEKDCCEQLKNECPSRNNNCSKKNCCCHKNDNQGRCKKDKKH